MTNVVLLCPRSWFQFNSRMFKHNDFEKLKNGCRNAKLRFRMAFPLPSTSCMLKLPIEPACRLKQKCPGTVNTAKAANGTIDFLLQFVPKIGDVLPASLAITVFCVSSKVSRAEATQKRD